MNSYTPLPGTNLPQTGIAYLGHMCNLYYTTVAMDYPLLFSRPVSIWLVTALGFAILYLISVPLAVAASAVVFPVLMAMTALWIYITAIRNKYNATARAAVHNELTATFRRTRMLMYVWPDGNNPPHPSAQKFLDAIEARHRASEAKLKKIHDQLGSYFCLTVDGPLSAWLGHKQRIEREAVRATLSLEFQLEQEYDIIRLRLNSEGRQRYTTKFFAGEFPAAALERCHRIRATRPYCICVVLGLPPCVVMCKHVAQRLEPID
jgi:hypothetical protein